MTLNPALLDFKPLNCSFDSTLGDYYQDLSPALRMIESGYHGPTDENGIPLLTVAGQGDFANAVTISQTAIANMTVLRRGDSSRASAARAQLDWLVKHQQHEAPWAGCWLMQHDNPKYAFLRAPWTGSLASGNAISALLRGHELFGDERYRHAAAEAYAGLHADRGLWTLYREIDQDLWYEEYPADVPLHVLNGHIYTMFAVLDYARVTGDAEARARWEMALATARRHLLRFDIGFWSIYDLRMREPTNVHYHKNIHIPQLRILAELTGDSVFTEVADRWQLYLSSRLCRVRLAVWLRVRARLPR
jgi:hypothetical protein